MSGTCEAKKLVHPKDLPIYDTVQDAPAPVPKPEEPSAALEAVKTVRLAIGDGIKQVEEAKGQVDHILETGRAHTECKPPFLPKKEFLINFFPFLKLL